MRQLKVKLDENMGQTHAEFLRQLGYHVQRVHEQGLSGKDDHEVWRKVCDEGWLFITLDLDFADIRSHPLGTHAGIVILRPRSHGRGVVLGVLRRLIREHALENLIGCLVIADEHKVRIRRPP